MIFLILLPTKEYFYSAPVLPLIEKESLELNTYHIIDPTNWKLITPDTITTTIKIKAIKGQFDFQRIMSIPSFGYHQDSGLLYSSINKIQGNDGWNNMNEARHNHSWFIWKPTLSWKNKSDILKSKELELNLIIYKKNNIPFPISFNIKFNDFNYNKVSRVWLTFTSNPFNIFNNNIVSKHSIDPPLILKNTNIYLTKSNWSIKNNIGIVKIPLISQQGNIDIKNISGNEKNKINSWFSWTIENKIQNKNIIYIICKINNNYKKTLQNFPLFYKIYVKDKHINRYIIVEIKLLENPF